MNLMAYHWSSGLLPLLNMGPPQLACRGSFNTKLASLSLFNVGIFYVSLKVTLVLFVKPHETAQWRLTLLDTLGWAQRESSSLLWNLSGIRRAAPRICRRWQLILGLPSGSRWLMLVSSISPATLSHTMTRFSIQQQCLGLFHRDMVGVAMRSASIHTSLWPEEMHLYLLWKWPSGLTPTSKWEPISQTLH